MGGSSRHRPHKSQRGSSRDEIQGSADVPKWFERLRILQGHAERPASVTLHSKIRDGDVCLLIRIDNEHPATGTGKHSCDGGHDGAFPNTTFLVRD